MSAKTIKSALGLLQDDPDNAGAWNDLEAGVGDSGDMPGGELVELLDAARRAHGARREAVSVARLLRIEVVAAKGTPREVDLLVDLARVLDEDLLDDAGSRGAWERVQELKPSDRHAAAALEESKVRRGKWREIADRYVEEAKGAGEATFRSSLLVSAAEVVFRYGREGEEKLPPAHVERVLQLLGEALSLDPKSRRAEALLERLLRQEERWDDLAAAMDRFANTASDEEKVASWVRLARVLSTKVKSPERAAAAYDRAIQVAPGYPEASIFLASLFTSSEMWDHLVALYEAQLSRGVLKTREDEVGTVLQIAMVHWRMRGKPEAAEPYFERLRKLEPAHPGMLSFFREWCGARGESARRATVLSEAQRAMPDGPERAGTVAEIAKLAEEGANAQKAIEQWRSVLRQDPAVATRARR